LATEVIGKIDRNDHGTFTVRRGMLAVLTVDDKILTTHAAALAGWTSRTAYRRYRGRPAGSVMAVRENRLAAVSLGANPVF
jgi:hypothetical protein